MCRLDFGPDEVVVVEELWLEEDDMLPVLRLVLDVEDCAEDLALDDEVVVVNAVEDVLEDALDIWAVVEVICAAGAARAK